MAQDSSSAKEGKVQEVDLDELEVNILILCKTANALNPAAQFLTRRGWPTTVMTNTSKAVEFVAEKKPDFVLISFSANNPAIAKLPDLFTQTFNITCIGFVETLDAASTSRLNNFKMRYKVQGSPSGPALQRTIRKILSERFNVGNEDTLSAKERERSSNEGSNVTIKGNNHSGNDKVNVQSSKSASGMVTVKGHGDSEGPGASGRGKQSGIGYMPDQKSGSQVGEGSSSDRKGGPAYMPKEGGEAGGQAGFVPSSSSDGSGRAGLSGLGGEGGSEGKADDAEASDRKGLNARGRTGQAGGAEGSEGFKPENSGSGNRPAGTMGGAAVNPSEGYMPDHGDGSTSGRPTLAANAGADANASSADNEDAVSNGKYKMAKKKPRKSLKELAPQGEAAEGAGPSGAAGGGQAAAEAATSADVVAAMKRSLFGESGEDQAAKDHAAAEAAEGSASAPQMSAAEIAALPPAGLLEMAVDQTLRRVCTQTQDDEHHPLGLVSKVGVFPIDSATLSGYLVVGMENVPEKVDDFFLKSCETSLKEDFQALSVPATLQPGFWVHVPEVRFVDWAGTKAQFQVLSPHDRSEVAVAYFPTGAPLPRAQISQEQDMYSIKIDDISTTQPINFKAYLHLKKNKKYFLYLRNGRRLQPEQKQRLKGRNVDNIFMKGVDVENLRMYLAAAFLRNSIKGEDAA
jgi:hypothetical protein